MTSSIQYISAAAEFHVLSMLNRLQIDASLTFGNTKKVDIVVQGPNGRTITIDSKGTIDNAPNAMLGSKVHSEDPNHFYAIVCFTKGTFDRLDAMPDVYIIPASEIEEYAYRPPGGAKIVQLHPNKNKGKAEFDSKYKNAWHLLKGEQRTSNQNVVE